MACALHGYADAPKLNQRKSGHPRDKPLWEGWIQQSQGGFTVDRLGDKSTAGPYSANQATVLIERAILT